MLRHELLIAAIEGVAVLLLRPGRNIRIPVLIAVVHVPLAVVAKILLRAIHPILKAPALDFAFLDLGCVEAAALLRHELLIAAIEGVAVLLLRLGWFIRIPVLVAVVHVPRAVVAKILLRAIHPIL